MKTDNQYMQAVEQAKANFANLRERGSEALGGTWDELEKELFTPEEIAASIFGLPSSENSSAPDRRRALARRSWRN